MKKILIALALSLLGTAALAQPGVVASPRWKPPVANAAALPATGNTIGDTRIALDDFVHWTWDGDSWETAVSGGGAGTVTSVAIAVPAEWTVSGSPVTTSGTITIAEATQTANTVYAGPASGGAAAPGFRSLVSDDIPSNAADTSGNAATATALASDPSDCDPGEFATAIAASGNLTCAADDTGTDDQTATEVAYTPTTGTDWSDPDPTTVGGGLDDLAARLTVEEAKADDDVPESGDFGAAADLEADGSLSADVVAAAEMADADHGDVSWSGGVATVDSGAVGLTELADDASCTGSQALRRNAGDTAFECSAASVADDGMVVSGAATYTTSFKVGTFAGIGWDQRDVLGITTRDWARATDGANDLSGFYAQTLLAANAPTSVGVIIKHDQGVTVEPTHGFRWSSGAINATVASPYTADLGFARDSADVARVTDGSTGIGSLLASRLVEASTAGSGAPNVLAATESGKCITNEGATAMAYNTLPTAVSGYWYPCFIVADADGQRVTAAAGDVIHLSSGATSTAGGYCESTDQWARLDDMQAINAADWSAVDSGTWTCDGP